ncbi:hypothetical protein BN133_4087 [Cronobacter dublinensis 582]|nr:hypothetical protein BN133_4087 [Cronobacter dublinensis 582]
MPSIWNVSPNASVRSASKSSMDHLHLRRAGANMLYRRFNRRRVIFRRQLHH